MKLREHATQKRIFKRAFAQPKRKGGYYRFAPHWWMAGYLVYDEPQRSAADSLPTSRRVGPWYASAFRPRVRQHFHAVLRAVQIDEIIVDDGVPYRAVERVMRALFELYDKHAGGRRAEDHLFRAVPKIRTMIHECEPESPLRLRRKPGYDEPQFEELSRARILHIFKDDGDHEALVGSPFDTSWEPSPTGYLG